MTFGKVLKHSTCIHRVQSCLKFSENTKKKVVGREENSLTSFDSQNVNFLGLHPRDLKLLLIFLWRQSTLLFLDNYDLIH